MKTRGKVNRSLNQQRIFDRSKGRNATRKQRGYGFEFDHSPLTKAPRRKERHESFSIA